MRVDSRVSSEEMARRLGVKVEEVEQSLDQLEKDQIVVGYKAIIDPEKLEDEPCVGIIEVKLSPQRERGYDDLASQIYRFPEVKLCYLLSGNYDLLVFVEGKSLKSVAMFVTERLATIDGVVSTTSHFILKKYKEAGVMMAGEEVLSRLQVSP